MPNRAQRREGTKSDVYRRAVDLDERRQKQIQAQIDSINRLLAKNRDLETENDQMKATMIILIRAAGGEITIPRSLIEESDHDTIVRRDSETSDDITFTTSKGTPEDMRPVEQEDISAER